MLSVTHAAGVDAVALVWRGAAITDTYSSVDVFSTFVDIYNAASNSWTRHPKGLVHARGFLTAASLSSGLVFFAGGRTSGMSKSTRVHFFASCSIYRATLFA